MDKSVNQFSNMVDALNYLQMEGFTHSFTCKEGTGLICTETREPVNPEELSIVSYHCF